MEDILAISLIWNGVVTLMLLFTIESNYRLKRDKQELRARMYGMAKMQNIREKIT